MGSRKVLKEEKGGQYFPFFLPPQTPLLALYMNRKLKTKTIMTTLFIIYVIVAIMSIATVKVLGKPEYEYLNVNNEDKIAMILASIFWPIDTIVDIILWYVIYSMGIKRGMDGLEITKMFVKL